MVCSVEGTGGVLWYLWKSQRGGRSTELKFISQYRHISMFLPTQGFTSSYQLNSTSTHENSHEN